jgi:hypothetical protein
LPAAPIDDNADAGDFPAMRANDIHGFLDASAARDHVLGHDEPLVRPNLETAPQNETTFVFFRKDVAFPKGAAHFLANDDAAQGGRNDGIAIQSAKLVGQPPANGRRDVGMLQKERTLEELPAVQAGAQDKMAVEQRAGLPKEREQILAH